MHEHPFLSFSPSKNSKRTLKKGAHLFHQSDLAEHVFFLQSGGVQIQRHLIGGHKITVHNVKSGESFAEASLFAKHYHCDAICVADSVVIQIPKTAALERLQSDHELSLTLMEVLSKQVQHYRLRLEIASVKSAEDRLIAALASELQFSTITELSSSIGLTHETCYRGLNRLKQKGLVQKIARGKYQLT